jgi:hypothetical protein
LYYYNNLFTPFLTDDEEHIAQMCGILAETGHSITKSAVKSLAYDYARANHIETEFNEETKMAGRDWVDRFMKRNRKILVEKKVTNIARHRALCANENVMDVWFQRYTNLIKNDLQINNPMYVWNIDECGLQNIPRESKVLGRPGQKAYRLTSGDKGTTTTLCTYVNGGGLACPPLIIFKGGVNVRIELRECAPQDWMIRQTESGYINSKTFDEYGVKFLAFLKDKKLDTPGRNVILLDSHSSHIYNAPYLQRMKDAGVRIWTFPAHVTHLLQPLDAVPFGVMKRCWQAQLSKWCFQHSGQTLGKSKEFFDLLEPAVKKGLSGPNIVAGFLKTGIWPIDRTQIKDSDMGPSVLLANRNNGIYSCVLHFFFFITGCTSCIGCIDYVVLSFTFVFRMYRLYRLYRLDT